MSKYLIAAAAALLCHAADAHAWGAARAGSTYHTPGGGYSHTSTRAAYGPYGEHSSTHTTGYNPSTGFYHSGSGQTSGAYGGSAHHSSAAYGAGGYGHGYAAGGYSTPYRSGAYAGAYRRW
jgi:hypothetical protein